MLHLRKVVVNDNGGTATVESFPLTADGAGANDLSGTSPVDSGTGLKADTFVLSETSLAGYTASDWVCTGEGTQDGASITLGLDEEATCTITNDDIAPVLHLRKIVTNDNGGTATVESFTLTADGAGANDLSGTSPVDSGTGLKADTFVLSETPLAGYTASDWVCTGEGTQDGASITLGLDEEATCTITNDDIAPVLHLRKVVVNDNGGAVTSGAFTLTADGTKADNDLSGVTPVDSDGTLQADTWALSENGPAGYAGTAWNCVGGTQNGSNITVGIGGEATCTITNDDIAPVLHLRKIVVNDNGGTASGQDFTLTADGAKADNDLSGKTPVDSDGTLEADTFELSETTVPGYAASAWSCTGSGTFTAATDTDKAKIALGLSETATCTITNDDIAPVLHLRKIVVNDNGGTATVESFPLKADGAGANDLSGTSPVDSGTGLKADTFELSETTVAGYAASAWSCTGSGTFTAATDTDNAKIGVGLNGSATCTHHQRRHRAGAAPAQGRGERQRWHRHGRELPAQGRRGRGQRPVRHQPGGLGYGAEG